MAKLDPTLRAYVNHEVFCFSSHDAMERFEKHPLRYCGLVTDPVNRARFKPSAASPHFEYGGRPYYFAAESTLVTFRAMPDSFATRKGM